MNGRPANIEAEIASIERKADQACSVHARLRDRYERRASALDYSVIAISTYLAGLVFVEPAIGLRLSLGLNPQLWIGGLSLANFFFAILQFKNDWKTVAQAHHRSYVEYAEVKSNCRTLTSGASGITPTEYERIRAQYNLATELGTHIPEKEFLIGKAHHKRKVYISQYLDAHPGVWIPLLRTKLFLRDNFNLDLLKPYGTTEQQNQKRD